MVPESPINYRRRTERPALNDVKGDVLTDKIIAAAKGDKETEVAAFGSSI